MHVYRNCLSVPVVWVWENVWRTANATESFRFTWMALPGRLKLLTQSHNVSRYSHARTPCEHIAFPYNRELTWRSDSSLLSITHSLCGFRLFKSKMLLRAYICKTIRFMKSNFVHSRPIIHIMSIPVCLQCIISACNYNLQSTHAYD